MKRIVTTMLAIAMLTGITTVDAQSKKEQKWFDNQEWLEGSQLTPAPSIDVELFAEHYKKHPNRWQTLFKYVAENDLSKLPLGQTRISDDITVNVQEYDTKRTKGAEVKFEKHVKNIDVQYVMSGVELHGAIKFADAELLTPYDETKDIGFYKSDVVPFYRISAGMFTIFFPEDAHTTNVGYGERTPIRKLVFKVLND